MSNHKNLLKFNNRIIMIILFIIFFTTIPLGIFIDILQYNKQQEKTKITFFKKQTQEKLSIKNKIKIITRALTEF